MLQSIRNLLDRVEAWFLAQLSKETSFMNVIDQSANVPNTNTVAGADVQSEAAVEAAALNAAEQANATSLLSRVSALLAIADRKPVAFDQISALAVKIAGTDEDAVLSKLEQLLAYSGLKVDDIWTETVAVAKALDAA